MRVVPIREKEGSPTEARVQKHSGVSLPIELSKSKLLKNVLYLREYSLYL